MIRLTHRLYAPLFICCALVLFGCAEEAGMDDPMAEDSLADTTLAMSDARMAWAELQSRSGSDVTGHIQFAQEGDGVMVTAGVRGLAPGQHGFHIHAQGDCSAQDASSAGPHFNPMDDPHGAPEDPPEEHHMGDLGNIEADTSGVAAYSRTVDFLTLTGENSIINKAVVVHANEDDLTSQPSGSAGPRVACGVITSAEGSM